MTTLTYTEYRSPLMATTALKKTPRTVLYAVGGVAIAVLIAAVVAEIVSPGSIANVRGATETVVAELGLILAAVAAAVPPVLALLNLTDDDEPDLHDPVEDGL